MRPFLAAAVAALLSAAPAAADADAPPYAAMRTLQALQEQVAHGNTTAQAAQPQLMAHIADGFLAAEPAAWREPRNARAAILFLLSGGRPAVIRTILERSSFPPELDRLLKGALAYGEGQDDIARALLDPIEFQSLPTALGAHLALVKANMFADENPLKAIKLLDSARLFAPGTLIEEAALRREVFLLIDKGMTDKAMLLSRQYFRRFRASSYAENFRQRFAAAAIHMATTGNTAQLSQLDSVMSELPAAETRAFYLSIARTALIDGKTLGAQFAAKKVVAMAGKDTADETRAKLYVAASSVVSEDPSAGLFALADLDPARLSPEDASIREAALAVGGAIRAQAAPAADAPGDGSASDPLQGTIEQARAALDESALLLEASKP